VYGLPQLLRTAEETGDLTHVPVPGDGRDLENVWYDELGRSVLGVLLQQLFEYRPSLGAVAVEEVLLLVAQPVGPLPAGTQRRVEGQVTEQVERVRFRLVARRGELVEVYAPLLQQSDDLRPPLRVGPSLAHLRR
jgi:hypothetical protein